MRLTGLESIQGSSEWLSWRKNKITASELPIIMGKSKFLTPYELWQQKLGFIDGVKDNFAMQKGRRLEPIVRDQINRELKCDYQSVVWVHDNLEWAAASLDGYDEMSNTILEIKCPGLEDHKTAEAGDVPLHYKDQIYWQLFCSGADFAIYASYYEGKIESVKIKLDHDHLINEMLPKATEFYRCLIEMVEPPTTEKDFIQITDEQFPEIAREWKAANEMAKFYKNKEDHFKKKLLNFTDDSNCVGCGLKIQRIKRDGSIEWPKVWAEACLKSPHLAMSLDPDSFRREQIGYWKVSEVNV